MPTRLLCPWNSPGKNIGVSCHPPSRGSSQLRDGTHISYGSCTGGQVLYHSRHLGSPRPSWLRSHLRPALSVTYHLCQRHRPGPCCGRCASWVSAASLPPAAAALAGAQGWLVPPPRLGLRPLTAQAERGEDKGVSATAGLVSSQVPLLQIGGQRHRCFPSWRGRVTGLDATVHSSAAMDTAVARKPGYVHHVFSWSWVLSAGRPSCCG